LDKADLGDRIVVRAEVQGGRPVIAGTRVPVELILGHLAAGMTAEAVAGEYGLTVEDVLAAVDYARKVVGEQRVEEFALE